MVTQEQITETVYGLTDEGAQIAKDGSHEYRVWEALPAKGGAAVSIPELQKALGADVVKIGQGRAFKNKWIAKDGAGFVRAADAVQDETATQLRNLTALSEKDLKEFQKRKLVVPRCVTAHEACARGLTVAGS